MLHALVEYAKHKGLHAETGFTPKNVRWLIVFNGHGRFLNVHDLADPNTKGSRGRTFPKVPHLKFSGDTPMRQFLVETAEYALLYEAGKPDKKLHAKHEFFLNLLKEAGHVQPRFRMLAKALGDAQTREKICEALASQPKRAKPSDNVTFAVIEAGQPHILVEDEGWHDWWRGYFPTLFPQDDEPAEPTPCLLTGEIVEPARTHPKIKGLGGVGGKVETTLIGFNQNAFCSYGLEQSRNAAVGKQAAEQYAAALNELIEKHSVTLAGTKVVYWYVGKADAKPEEVKPENDPVQLLLRGAAIDQQEADQEEGEETPATGKRVEAQALAAARGLLEAVRSGKSSDLAKLRFNALTISGNSARVVVRDWMEGQFKELARNVADWFRHLQIVARHGDGLAPDPKFLAVVAASVRDLDDIAAPLVSALWHVALCGRGHPIPYEVAARTLARVRADIVNDDPANHARLGLLKAFCIRNGDPDMQPYLNESHPEPAYHCGRLLAVLAYIQWKALGDVGAGVVQRYYAAASATPALVLGRLTRTAQFHLDKIQDKGVRLGLDKRLAEIWGRIQDRVPATLTLEQQSLFAMGYYQQKAYRGPAESEKNADEA